MRDWRHVGDAGDFITTAIQSTNGRFTSRTWTLDVHVEVLEAVFQCRLTSTLCSYLSSKGGAFTRTTETGATGSGPGQRIALTIGDSDDGVFKRGMDAGYAIKLGLF